MTRLLVPLLTLGLLTTTARAEPMLKLEHRAQFWLMSTFDAEADPGTGLTDVDPHGDAFFRRGRVRLGANFPKNIELLVQLQYDGVGEDTGTLGATEGAGPVDVKIRDAYATWGIVEDELELTAGFFHPSLSREAETSSFSVLSFEKSDLQTYVREHVMGQNSGRVAGLRLKHTMEANRWRLSGALGAFDGTDARTNGAGLRWSPLLTGRLELTRGEAKAAQNPGSENGITVGLDGSWQGGTDVFEQNASFGADVAMRIGGFALIGEAHGLVRDSAELTIDRVWMVRAAWAIAMGEKFLQPVVTYTRYDGESGSTVSGDQHSVEAALIAMLTKKLRVGLAVNWSNGSANSLFTDGASFRRGPWVAVGIQHAM